MEYKYSKCPICGSEEINIVLYNKDENGNIFYRYKCNSCDSYFSSDKLIKNGNKSNLNKASNLSSNKNEPTSNTLTSKQVFDKNIPYTLELSCENVEGNDNQGTGIILTKQYIVTNAHVVVHNGKPFKRCVAKTNNDEFFELELVSYDVNHDIAFLKANILFNDCISFRKTNVYTGETCYAIGNSKGEGLSFLDGVISSNHRDINGNDYIMFSAPITNGNSGGPLLDEFGSMIGMVTLGTKGEVGMNYAIPNSVISKFLDTLKK